MRLLVTGCGGFIGSHLLERLLAREDVSVIGWDSASDRITHLLDRGNFRFRQQLVKEGESLAAFEADAAESDWIVNLAAICNPSRYNTEPVATIRANFIDCYPVVEIAARHRTPLLHFSTSEVYGRTLASYLATGADAPPDLYRLSAATTPLIMGPVANQRWTYAAAKQLLERLIYACHAEAGLPFAIIRPFNFFGPRMDYLPGIEGEGKPRVLAMFIAAMLRGEPMKLVDGGTARRTITSIHDAVDATLRILDRPDISLGHIYNIGNPANEVSMRELAEELRESFVRVTGETRFRDHPIMHVSGTAFYGPGYEDCDRRLLDISEEARRLDWRPSRDLRQLLDETVAYYHGLYGAGAPGAGARDG